jgi:ribonuclease BN (tRNA processing enzyme)
MRLVTVGTSGSMSGPRAPAAAHLVQATDSDGRTWSIVLDLGPGGLGRLMEHVDPREVDGLFFSHLHPDHMADVTSMHVYLRYHPEGESGPLPTWGPEQTAERIAAICWMTDMSDVERQFDVRRHEPGRVVEIGPLRVEAVPVRHPVPAFGLRIEGPSETPGRTATIAYTGDTDACPELAALADGVDLLLAEASFQEGREDMIRGIHLTGRRAGELAAALPGGEWDEIDGPTSNADPVARRPVGRLVLTHLPPWTDPEVVSTEAREVYAGPVEVATSGSTWVL